jgi:Protein of unknwon function (DUF3008)
MPERGLLIAERSEERTESPPEFIEDRPTRLHSRPRKNPEVQFQAPTGCSPYFRRRRLAPSLLENPFQSQTAQPAAQELPEIPAVPLSGRLASEGAWKQMAQSMSEKQLRDFAKTHRKRLPTNKV